MSVAQRPHSAFLLTSWGKEIPSPPPLAHLPLIALSLTSEDADKWGAEFIDEFAEREQANFAHKQGQQGPGFRVKA